MSRRFFPIFSSRSFMLSGLIFKFLKLKLIFVTGVREWFNVIVLQYLFSFPSNTTWRDHPVPIGSLTHLPMLVDFVCKGLILGSLALVNMSIFMPKPYCTHYCFVVYFKIRKQSGNSSFSRLLWLLEVFWCFHKNFRIFSIYVKNAIIILTRLLLNL